MRHPDYPIHELFIKRWSPRAMSGQEITDQELFTLFEAARWAPSSYNNQPWRFIYAKRNTSFWDAMFNLLVPQNQTWCKDGAALIVIMSHNTFEYNNRPSRTHSFDAGSAWENLALQAAANGLVAHGLEGFDYERAQKELYIPSEYTIEAMCVIGKKGSLDHLSKELQDREKPSERKPLKELVFEGSFKMK